MQNFETEYNKLNAQQLEAVETIDGPLLVIAGPGTGKTQLLSMRVANILIKTDSDPRSILCLTFTNKAATNMRERLLSLIGSDAHAIQVKTFHSFAADIMTQYPDYFWNGARLTTAPDAVQLSVIQDILSRLPLDNPLALRFSGQFTTISDVQNGLKLTKEAGLTPEKLQALIQANLGYLETIEPELVEILAGSLNIKRLASLKEQVEALPDQKIDELVSPLLSLRSVLVDSLQFAVEMDEKASKTTNTGAWKRRWIQTLNGQRGMFDERRRNEWWLNLAGVYAQYRDELGRRGYYDYSDMLVQVISQLEQSEVLRAQVQEQFLYLLIDEFQDTNAAQLRLAHLVAVHYNDPKPNLMAVGDDDQSIFKFNGAELNNMLSFKRIYPSSKVIVLTKNYRSTQAVLDAAAAVIEQAGDRLVKREPSLNKNLEAVNPPYKQGLIELQTFPTREHQYTLLAQQIGRRLREHPEKTIAVLARSHSSLRSIATSLHKENIPLRYEQQQNILEHAAVRQLLLLGEATTAIGNGDEQRANAVISQMLKHPMWNINPKALWQLAKSNFAQPQWLESLLNNSSRQLKLIGHWLVWLSAEASYQPLPVMLEYLLGIRPGEHMSSPVHEYFISRRHVSSIYLETLSAVHKLRGLVQEFSIGVEEPNLGDFVSFVELNRINNRVITDSSWFSSLPGAVELLSVHKAKGLEFDTVYIVDAVEKEWQPRKAGRKPPANLPLQPYGDDFDDYVRLLYVAMTRAKFSIIVSSYASDENGEPVLPSSMVHKLPVVQLASIPEESSILSLENAVRWPRLEKTDEHELLQTRLENYQLSVTHLLNFLDVTSGGPQSFLERNMLRLPDIKGPKLAFGTAAHKAMETAQKLVNNRRFNLKKVLSAYEEALLKEYLPQPDYERYIVHGQQVLRRLFEDLSYELPEGGQPEQSFHHVVVGEARLSGSLDRIERLQNRLVITDYKTGQPLNSFDTRDKSKQIKAWKQRTQLIFYTLLLQNSSRFSKFNHISGQMVYLETESPNQLTRSYTATSDDLEQLSRLIQKVWHHIMSLNFPDTESYPAGMQGIQAFIQDLLDNKL